MIAVRDLKVDLYVYNKKPLLDFRDSGTVWIWIDDDCRVEISRDLVEEILQGFIENEVCIE